DSVPRTVTWLRLNMACGTGFVPGCCFDPLLRGLGKFEATCFCAYLIEFTPRRTASAGGESKAAAIPEFSSSVSAIAAATCVRKKADSSARILRLGLRKNSYSPQFVQISKVDYFFLATCSEECQRLSDRKQLSASNLQYILRRVATDRAVVVPPRAGKLQRFHRLSTGSGTRVVVRGSQPICARATPNYSGGGVAPSAIDSNRVELFRKAMRMVPVGPLRCLRIRISATPSSSGSSGL